MPIAACSTPGTPPLEVLGAEQFAQTCPSQPPALSQADVEALLDRYPTAEERERAFWAPRDLDHRACELYERSRSDALLSLIARHNQIVREAR